MKPHSYLPAHVWVFLWAVPTMPFATAAQAGAVDLEWEPERVVVTPGETVNLKLLAVSQDEINDAISAMDVVVLWDSARVSLLGVLNNGPYAWLSSGFPVNAVGGLNTNLTDGDATYTARSQFPPAVPAAATSNGLHVTTFRFDALAEEATTSVAIAPSQGAAQTRVISGEIPGLVISDQLGTAEVVIINCELLDFDADGDTDLRDYAGLQQCSTVEEESAEFVPCLCTFDADRNGHIQEPDFTPFAAAVTGPT